MEILLEKFKEKKVILREPLIECIDYLSLIVSFFMNGCSFFSDLILNVENIMVIDFS